ncbi:HNH endonuclease [Streptomyces sp. NPDC096030]|uniref:HNH endonuclease n=1 Tax=Streptomyces sp. NPDC096030 TaxID=3155423 RepID=UPI00332E58BF
MCLFGTAGTAAADEALVAAVERIPVEAESPSGYLREAFGYNSAAVRPAVLEQESRVPVVKDDSGKVLAGEWVSAWDGITHTDAAAVEADHTVALAEAWASGARSWDASKRQQFASDTVNPEVLNTVTAALNQQKGDRDPAEWLPPAADRTCEYIRQWTHVKQLYGLSADQPEKEALTATARQCPPAASTPAPLPSASTPAPLPSAAALLAQTGSRGPGTLLAVAVITSCGAVAAAAIARRRNAGRPG